MAARDLDAVTSMLAECDELGLEDAQEYGQARALQERLEEEKVTVEALTHAAEDRDLTQLSALLTKMSELGLDGRQEMAQARKVRDELQEEVKAKNQLRDAAADTTPSKEVLDAVMEKGRALKLGAARKGRGSDARQDDEQAAAEDAVTKACVSHDGDAVRAAVKAARRLASPRAHQPCSARRAKGCLLGLKADALTALSSATASGDEEQVRSALRGRRAGSVRCRRVQVGVEDHGGEGQGRQGARRSGERDPRGDEAAINAAIAEAEAAGQGQSADCAHARTNLSASSRRRPLSTRCRPRLRRRTPPRSRRR